MTARAVAKGLTWATAFALVPVAGIAWLLRDGLGPDATDAHGLEAVARFGRAFVALLGTPIGAPAGLLAIAALAAWAVAAGRRRATNPYR